MDKIALVGIADIEWKSRCRLTPVGGKKLTPSSK